MTEKKVLCPECNGLGIVAGGDRNWTTENLPDDVGDCPTCHGTGEITVEYTI